MFWAGLIAAFTALWAWMSGSAHALLGLNMADESSSKSSDAARDGHESEDGDGTGSVNSRSMRLRTRKET